MFNYEIYPCDVSGFCPYAVENCSACKSREPVFNNDDEEDKEGE